MSFCKDCIQGVRHEGTPQGKWEKIGGIESYVGTPSIDYPKDKVVLYLSDVFGPKLINTQLLVDDYAANGFKTVALDLFDGGAAPENAFNPGVNFDLNKWFAGNGPEKTRIPLDKVIAALKEEGVTTFYAVGYCYGARLVFDLAFENGIKAAVVAHPSLLKVPEDLEKYVASSQAPLLINSCTYDHLFPAEAQAKADEIFGDGKFKPGYKRRHFEGCTHGFTIRGDLSDPKVKAGKEGAFKETIEWFLTHL